MRSFLVRKINNFTKTLSLRAKVPNTYGTRLYMDTDLIYAKLNITHEEYVEILQKNKDSFGNDIGQIEPESLNNPIQEGVFLSSKSYLYICKNDIVNNKHKLKNNILHQWYYEFLFSTIHRS